MGVCQRGTGDNGKSSLQPKLGQFKQQNKIVLNYKRKYKINVSILIKINDCVN